MGEGDLVSILTVNHNGKQFLPGFFQSLFSLRADGLRIEALLVDNLSTDDSVQWVRQNHPGVMIIPNTVNNYCRALNLAIAEARGEYIVVVNNDAELHPDWLHGLWEIFQSDERIGVAQSKILFSDRRTVNSVGGEEIQGFYFRDIGFGKRDRGQYDRAREITYFSGGSAMFRRQCLLDVGPFDEDFIMFYEDMDFSIRVRNAGWKMHYAPASIIYHKFHGTSSDRLANYLCSRNRLLLVAKHFPGRLAESVRTSNFYWRGEFNELYRSMLQAVRKLAQSDLACTKEVMGALKQEVINVFGPVGAHNFFSQMELMLGLRRLRVGIYDHAFQLAGGGQRYVASIAEHLQDKYDITYISNKDATLEQYREWYDIDLSRCSLKIVKIPFFERSGKPFIDEGMVTGEPRNPFEVISEESLGYDVFVNANMLGKVRPLSPASVFVCHFPDRKKERFFAVDQYDHVVSNSKYTEGWIRERWGIDATDLIYPPVDMADDGSDPGKKEPVILSVARFEQGGSKKQAEMARAFIDLTAGHPGIKRTWKLVLAGGSPAANPYLEEVARLAQQGNCNIELKTNLGYDQIKALYRSASIFWHACGLNETEPHLIEHFGMATVEAMQNYCVPIVIRGGGQLEIVEDGINGFTFSTVRELQTHTVAVINDEARRVEVARKAYRRGQEFSGAAFKERVDGMFSEIEKALMGVDTL